MAVAGRGAENASRVAMIRARLRCPSLHALFTLYETTPDAHCCVAVRLDAWPAGESSCRHGEFPSEALLTGWGRGEGEGIAG